MSENYLEKLEFNRVLKSLANFCSTKQAKEFVYGLKPSHHQEEVHQLLNQTRRSNFSYISKFFSFFSGYL